MAGQDQRREYSMPSLGADMDVGTVIEWNVGVGDRVQRGDVVARVETEKSDIDIEIWFSGTVTEILVPPGRRVPVGTPLLEIAADRGDGGAVATQPASEDERTTPPRRAPTGDRAAAVVPQSGVWATPLARRLAAERGVDLAGLTGSGPGGAVRRRDLPAERAADPGDAVPGGDASPGGAAVSGADDAPTTPPRTAADVTSGEPGTGTDRAERMRRAIAARMTASHREIPLYHLERQVDLAPLLDHLGALNATREIADRVLPAAAFVDAVAMATARHGEFNGHWVDGGFVAKQTVDVGVAISIRGGGLVTPMIDDADGLGLDGIMDRLRVLTTEARSGVMRGPSERLASITVTNLGERGADLVHGLISPPEVALVGFGRVVERPWVVDGSVMVRPVVHVTLAADHRATDGATGSRFLATIARALEQPEDRSP